jgi:hypothetical protein
VSEPEQPAAPHEAGMGGEIEEVDALPVLSGPPQILSTHAGRGALPSERVGTVLPAVQAAAVAAGGFVAGAAVVGLVHRRHKRAASAALSRGRRGAGDRGRRGGRVTGAGELLQIVGSRSLLLDVHLLGGSDDR